MSLPRLAVFGFLAAFAGLTVDALRPDPTPKTVSSAVLVPPAVTSTTATDPQPTSTSTTSSTTTLPEATFEIPTVEVCTPGGFLPGERVAGHVLPLDVAEAICRHWTDDLRFAVAMMACEAGFDRWADNPISTAAGIAQFLRSSWNAYARLYGVAWTYDDGSPFVLDRAVELAAFAHSLDGRRPWSGAGTSEPCWRRLL